MHSRVSLLFVTLHQVPESALLDNPLKAVVIPVAYTFSFHVFPEICFERELSDQPACSSVAFCVSVSVSWTTVKSAVFLITVIRGLCEFNL